MVSNKNQIKIFDTSLMFSSRFTGLLPEVLSYPIGLYFFRMRGESFPYLIIKALHQFILSAKMAGGLKIYVVPVSHKGVETIGLISTFFDDADSPLTIWTHLTDDEYCRSLISALFQGELAVHMFDEHDRELLGYSASVEVPLKSKMMLEHAKLYPLDHEVAHSLCECGLKWFGLRTAIDDLDAISIKFTRPFYEENRVVVDQRPEFFRFHGSKGFSKTTLIKEEPGLFQELDIILLLQKIFKPEEIYHAPLRHYDKEEIADVMVITETECILIQAKDSPNTELILANTLKRKELKAKSQLKEGCRQALGAIGYLKRTRPLKFYIEETLHTIDLERRNILSLIVVRELFNHDYDEYGDILFKLFEDTELPCIGIDYAELFQYTTYCSDANSFINAYFQVFDFALENGQYPRLRFGMNDLFREDGSFKF